MRKRESSCNADVGKITARKILVIKVKSLTFIAAVHFWLADKSWAVNFVAAQEYVVWVGIAATNVGAGAAWTTAIMTFILGVLVTSKNAVELWEESFWLGFREIVETLTINYPTIKNY